MDNAALKEYILADAELAELAGEPGEHGDYRTSQDGTIADILNTPCIPSHASRTITASDLMRLVPANDAAEILDALEIAAARNSQAKWAVRLLLSTGFDVGCENALNMIDDLVATNALTVAQRETLRALSAVLISRAQHEFGQSIHNLDVARALGRLDPVWMR